MASTPYTPMKDSRYPRQLLIGLDAMELDLVQRWVAAGKMPTFRRLMEEGCWAQLSSVADRLPDTVWNCVCSGLNPAHFPRYFYVQHDPRTGGLRYMSDESFATDYLWDHLSDGGLRVGVVDVPHVAAGLRLNGFQIAGWGTHAAHSPRASIPRSLLPEVEKMFGRHPVGECDAAGSTPAARQALRERVLAGVKAHGELFRHCITERLCQVLITVFAAPHCAGHLYWHYMDRSHPWHDPEDRHQLASTIEEVYRAIDREIGMMIEAAGPDTLVYVFSPDGMGPLYHASWNLPEILDNLGYASQHSNPLRSGEKTRKADVNFWRILRMAVPGKLQYAIHAALPRQLRNQLLFRLYGGTPSSNKCRAFAVPNNEIVGAIRINLKGRDLKGVVEPGPEYEHLCDEICHALAELKDPVSGRTVVKSISRPQQELHGPYLHLLPDITVLWEQSFPWQSVYSPALGTIQLRVQDSRTGSHTSHAFLLARGPGVRKQTILAGASIFDIVPSVLRAAGVRTPAPCEGQPRFVWQ
jgi:predicted AlkP superfamily phosphohydrolase/phosphomutase